MGGKTSSLRPEAMYDLQEATSFTEEEIRKWYKEFMKDFPGGQLSIDQFKDVYMQHFPNGDATKFAEHVFRTFDKDNDHVLDFREFMCAVNVTAQAGPRQRLQWAFEMYDIDENGFITQDECREIMRAIYKLSGGEPADSQISPEERSQMLFDKMDYDKDGCISEEEFVNGARTDGFLVHLLTQDQLRF